MYSYNNMQMSSLTSFTRYLPLFPPRFATKLAIALLTCVRISFKQNTIKLFPVSTMLLLFFLDIAPVLRNIGGHPISPSSVTNRLTFIGAGRQWGSQGEAPFTLSVSEFDPLTNRLFAMLKSCLNNKHGISFMILCF